MRILSFGSCKTNIEGTNNILTAANRTKVKKIICLSTDKVKLNL